MAGLIDPFRAGFLRDALAEAVLTGIACGLLGSLVIVRGMTYLGESMSHMLLPGAAIAVALGAAPNLGGLAAGLVCAAAISWAARRDAVGEDAAIGVVYTGALATGVIVLYRHGTPQDLDSLLFGDVLAADAGDVRFAAVVVVLLLAGLAASGRGLALTAFDAGFARAVGARVGLLDLALAGALAATLAVALQGVGTLLVLALLIAPAAAARVLAPSFGAMLTIAPALAALASVIGIEVSYHASLAAGASIALAAIGLFLLALAAARGRTLLVARHG